MKEICSVAERQILRSGIRSRVLETRVGPNARATFSGCHSDLHSTLSGGSGAPPVVRARKSPKRRVKKQNLNEKAPNGASSRKVNHPTRARGPCAHGRA